MNPARVLPMAALLAVVALPPRATDCAPPIQRGPDCPGSPQIQFATLLPFFQSR